MENLLKDFDNKLNKHVNQNSNGKENNNYDSSDCNLMDSPNKPKARIMDCTILVKRLDKICDEYLSTLSEINVHINY